MATIANPSIGEQRADRLRHAQEQREQARGRARRFLTERNSEEAADADS